MSEPKKIYDKTFDADIVSTPFYVGPDTDPPALEGWVAGMPLPRAMAPDEYVHEHPAFRYYGTKSLPNGDAMLFDRRNFDESMMSVPSLEMTFMDAPLNPLKDDFEGKLKKFHDSSEPNKYKYHLTEYAAAMGRYEQDKQLGSVVKNWALMGMSYAGADTLRLDVGNYLGETLSGLLDRDDHYLRRLVEGHIDSIVRDRKYSGVYRDYRDFVDNSAIVKDLLKSAQELGLQPRYTNLYIATALRYIEESSGASSRNQSGFSTNVLRGRGPDSFFTDETVNVREFFEKYGDKAFAAIRGDLKARFKSRIEAEAQKWQTQLDDIRLAETEYAEVKRTLANVSQGSHLAFGLMGLIDPDRAEEFAQLNALVQEGVKLYSAVQDMMAPAMASVSGASPYVTAAVAVMTIIGFIVKSKNKPLPNPVIEMLKVISKQISQMRKEMHERFDRLEEMMGVQFKEMMDHFVKLHVNDAAIINALSRQGNELVKIRESLNELHDKVDYAELQADRREIDFMLQPVIAEIDEKIIYRDDTDQESHKDLTRTMKHFYRRSVTSEALAGKKAQSADKSVYNAMRLGVDFYINNFAEEAGYPVRGERLANPLLWSEGLQFFLPYDEEKYGWFVFDSSFKADCGDLLRRQEKNLRGFIEHLHASPNFYGQLVADYEADLKALFGWLEARAGYYAQVKEEAARIAGMASYAPVRPDSPLPDKFHYAKLDQLTGMRQSMEHQMGNLDLKAKSTGGHFVEVTGDVAKNPDCDVISHIRPTYYDFESETNDKVRDGYCHFSDHQYRFYKYLLPRYGTESDFIISGGYNLFPKDLFLMQGLGVAEIQPDPFIVPGIRGQGMKHIAPNPSLAVPAMSVFDSLNIKLTHLVFPIHMDRPYPTMTLKYFWEGKVEQGTVAEKGVPLGATYLETDTALDFMALSKRPAKQDFRSYQMKDIERTDPLTVKIPENSPYLGIVNNMRPQEAQVLREMLAWKMKRIAKEAESVVLDEYHERNPEYQSSFRQDLQAAIKKLEHSRDKLQAYLELGFNESFTNDQDFYGFFVGDDQLWGRGVSLEVLHDRMRKEDGTLLFDFETRKRGALDRLERFKAALADRFEGLSDGTRSETYGPLEVGAAILKRYLED